VLVHYCVIYPLLQAAMLSSPFGAPRSPISFPNRIARRDYTATIEQLELFHSLWDSITKEAAA
jgi:hypothetical protein